MSEVCPRDDIAAYVDGEVSAGLAAELELHFAECEACTRSLREQRQFLSALSASLANEPAVELPEDFTKKIVVSAESSVTGVRGRGELLTAALICAVLILFSIFAIGESLGAGSAFGGIGEKVFAVGAVILRSAGNTATAAAVLIRALSAYVSVGVPAFLAFGIGAVVVVFLSSVWVIKRRNA